MAYTPIGKKGTQKKVGYTPIGSTPTTKVSQTTPQLPPAEVPFDATKTGIAVNTIKGLPQAAKDVASSARKFLFPYKEEVFQQLQEEKQQSLLPTEDIKREIDLRSGTLTPPKQGESFTDFLKRPGIAAPDFAGVTTNISSKIFNKLARETNPKKVSQVIRESFTDIPDDVVESVSKKIAKTESVDDIQRIVDTEIAPKIKTPTQTAPVRATDESVPTPVKQTPTVPALAVDNVIENANPPTKIPDYTQPVQPGLVAKAEAIKSGVVKSIADILPVTNNGRVQVKTLSKIAHNSLQNNKSGIRPESIAAQTEEVIKGTSPRVVEVRVLDDGRIDIVDGRHLLETARRNGKQTVTIKDVTSEYFPDGVPTSNFFKTKKGTELPPLPKFPSTQSPDQVIGSALERYRVGAKGPETVLPDVAEAGKVPTSPGGFMVMASKLLTPISSRLERINPKLKEVLRRFEYNVSQNTHKDSTRILPLLNATKQLSKEESLIFDLARKNGDADVINAIAKKYGFENELRESQRVLDEIYDRAKEVGIDIPYRENYFPRVVKNPEKYVAYLRSKEDWSEIQAMVEKHAADRGKKYTDLTSEEIAGIVNNFLRGFGNKIDLAKPGFAKKRSVEVIDDTLNDFYETSDSALSTYVIRMNDEIEGRKFFGKALKADEKTLNNQDSIGAYVMDLIQKGELKPQFEREVSDILKARFARGKMNGAFDAFRNMEYISTMGSPISAITQIADVSWSLYDNGIYNTIKSLGKSAFGKRVNRVTKEDLGIEQITQEFQNQSKTGKALEKVFKYVGMERLDRLGKETLVNAELMKFKSQAKKNDPRLLSILNRTFEPDEVPQVMQEFAEGKITDNTKLVLFNKLLDFQPVAKSEMPQVYLENPNGRIFYMLKSFTLKQYDIFRRNALDKIATGEKKQVAQGMKNLVLLAGAFTMANATSDEIKDLILGRETPPSDRVVDNLWRLLGASKYDVYKARQDGVGSTLLRKILFPMSLLDRAGTDVKNFLEGKEYEKGPLKGDKYKLESTQSIPVGGKLYYWWMGRGEQKEQYKAGSKGEFPELPELPKLPELPELPKLPKINR